VGDCTQAGPSGHDEFQHGVWHARRSLRQTIVKKDLYARRSLRQTLTKIFTPDALYAKDAKKPPIHIQENHKKAT
jgi:hypothetical protein